MRTILHFLSVVKWDNLAADSNFEVFLKTMRWLSGTAWHHYVLLPWRAISAATELLPDVSYTLLPFEYPANALAARHEFRAAEFAQRINLRKMDIDFLFCHQPELLGNLLAAFSAKRASDALISFVFFHWIDCPESRSSGATVPVAARQLEAIALADRFFVHSPSAYVAYFPDAPIDKVTYIPLSAAPLPDPEMPRHLPEPPYVVFNHRRTHSTGWKRLEAWLPDGFNIAYTGTYSPAEYRWILEHAHCAVCMIDSYCTWNLAVQDPVNIGIPLICCHHPTLRQILGKSPLVGWFTSRDEFQRQIRNPPARGGHPLENFDVNFRTNLIRSIATVEKQIESRRREGSKHTVAWKAEILKQPTITKAQLVQRVHGKTASAHASWQYVRRDLTTDGYESRVVNDETVWYA